MAAKIVDQGLQRIAVTASQVTAGGPPAYDAARYIRTMAVDDSASAFTAGTTTLGSPSNLFDLAFDGAPTRSGLIVTHIATVPTGNGNFTIRRVSLHDDTVANVTGSSSTLVAGIDGLALTKTSDFSLAITMRITYSDNS